MYFQPHHNSVELQDDFPRQGEAGAGVIFRGVRGGSDSLIQRKCQAGFLHCTPQHMLLQEKKTMSLLADFV